MMNMTIGLLHPGDMGASIGAAAVHAGHRVLWVRHRRSPATTARAEQAKLAPVDNLTALCGEVQLILSVCPPHAAVEVAAEVAACGYTGRYVDANAISPGRSLEVQSALGNHIDYVDGGIIGPPARKAGSTRLYLSGTGAGEVSALFQGSVLEAIALQGHLTSASAVKICYAAWTKGYAALLGDIRALARQQQVEPALLAEWDRSQPGLREKSMARTTGNAHKAWRWIAEMHEIADSFAAADLPDGFHRASAEIYRRLENFKDVRNPPDMDAVIESLLDNN